MAVALLIPTTAAATFTLGCALIHGQRRHPERITRVLVALTLLVLLCFVIRWTSNEAAIAEATADAANPLLEMGE
ncbi:hypothetical protein G3T14_01650 [Methylobacterium sp. BTF04]|uniref:hypothetical protein n=1 Tax=Methylobacterium sp. BTF04 TaxID=2708300 RepID=UPI0013D79EE5|nr:hypothetical protein [Methylobacterium sp. BTF04]NEU10836.1 hypothetical protein [Methylobacterium sp. BTF04]